MGVLNDKKATVHTTKKGNASQKGNDGRKTLGRKKGKKRGQHCLELAM